MVNIKDKNGVGWGIGTLYQHNIFQQMWRELDFSLQNLHHVVKI